jgi:1,4-dihydroxy-2-naphthoate octaprenyltransferase
MAETATALGLGALPILLFYFIQTGSYALGAIVGAVAAGFLMFNTHLLNGVPDVEADAYGGRKTLPIVLGIRGAAYLYTALAASFYVWVIAWAAAGAMPLMALLSLLTMPVAVFTSRRMLASGSGDYSLLLWSGAVVCCMSLALLSLGYAIG